MMATIKQLLTNSRVKSAVKQSNSNLGKSPQRKAICLKLLTMSPKKPNSANRKVAKVNVVWSSKQLTVKIPGEGHNLQAYSVILLKTSVVRDLIGVSNVAIRGKLDLLGVSQRKTSRSVYGVKLK